ncbi:hypothetical protein [Thiosulfativibrio zosterae]|uniref:Uncharacterized protein n=1 Tax=Thiosulfativibrio zosterae TaxID=2675053 RepID=A0A6F8PR01_9GAMM|nr:hypothetical protein [Thiosulfativibrio zosterae]BBP44551.1 hypothetical protein THMIRHAT_22970 [Thiosulfativibrio zosterae]
MSRKTKRTAKQASYPFFLGNDFPRTETSLDINPDWSYGDGCNAGKAGAYDFIRYLCDSKACGGDLQLIALGLAKLPLTNGIRGFTVGFFSTMDDLLRDAYANDSVKGKVKSDIENRHLNNAELSPLSFRERGGEA